MQFLSKFLVKNASTLKSNFHVCASLLNNTEEATEPIVGVPYESLTVGFVKEEKDTRVAQTPQSVEDLVKKGFTVFAEKGCGDKAKFSDAMYQKAGATVLDNAEAVISKSDIFLKINPPTEAEIDAMNEGASIISFLYPAQNTEIVDKLLEANVNAFAMDCVPRISRAQVFDALSSMANISGYKAIIEAANHYTNFFAGQMTAAGRVEPAKVLVIGAGVAGLAAIQTAKNMGAIVRGFDTRAETKEQVESMGASFLTVDIEESGDGGGGYAKEMSKEFIEAEMELFRKQLEEVDIVVTTALIPGKPAPLLIKKEHIQGMKPGSVVVDLAASNGGNIETIMPGKIYDYQGVTHIGYTDFPAQVPTVSSTLYANNIRKLLYSFEGTKKHFFIDICDEVTRGAIVAKEGEMMFPAPLPEVTITCAQPEPEVIKEVVPKRELSVFQKTLISSALYTAGLAGVQSIGLSQDPNMVQTSTIFSLGCIVGYKVVNNVLPALHSPLISVTNAVSGIITAGGLLLMGNGKGFGSQALGAAAVFISSVNVFGGFLITHKMLQMFVKKEDPKKFNYLYSLPALATGLGYLMLQGKDYPQIHNGTNLMAALCCIMAISGLTQHSTTAFGNAMGMTGVGLGILSTIGSIEGLSGGMLTKMLSLTAIGGGLGVYVANKVELTDLPQLVALFHSFVGVAACLISMGNFVAHPNGSFVHDLSISLGAYIGGITATGSLLAFMKLQGLAPSGTWALPNKNLVNAALNGSALALSAFFCKNMSVGGGFATLTAITTLAMAGGAHLTSSIGGADMPVVITVLNSASGWALCAEGFMLNNTLLTVVGALVGASGAILSDIMCKAMNRSIGNVLFQGIKTGSGKVIEGEYTETSPEELADWLVDSQKIVIVPGFGLAVSKSQYALSDMVEKLRKAGKEVMFSIHPVAGRMPGQLNVLLAEAGIPHDIVFEMDELEDVMEEVDTVLCIGSNDIYNSAANDDEECPIYGMPVINVWDAKKTVVFKRAPPGSGLGYSMIDNPVFYHERTSMMLGDAKETCDKLLAAVTEKLG